MAGGAVGAVARGLGRLFSTGGVSGLNEGQLLERFVAQRDEAAFEALVVRHGPMVLGVCRQLLHDPNDVDDAFQATFLVLVRKAGTLRRRDLLGNWLYGVAYRVALRARGTAARRLATETPTEGMETVATARGPSPTDEAALKELHDEVHRLPDHYRAPVVLCDLQGLTHEEAAAQLGWPVGTVKGRLSRARNLLRTRLTRRGLDPAACVALPALLRRGVPLTLPAELLDPTLKAAALAAVGETSAAGLGLLSTQAVALSEGVLHVMSMTQLKLALASCTVAGTLLTAAGALAYQTPGDAAPKVETFTKEAAAGTASKTQAETQQKGFVPAQDLDAGLQAEMDAAFDRFLSARKTWSKEDVDRLLSWSSNFMSMQAEPPNTPNPRNNADRLKRAHVNRMKRLNDVLQRTQGPNHGELVAAGQRAVRLAENDQFIGPIPPPPIGKDPEPAEVGPPTEPVPSANAPITPPPSPAPAPATPKAAVTAKEPVITKRAVKKSEAMGEPMTGMMMGGMGWSVNPQKKENNNRLRLSIAGLAASVAEADESPKTKAILKKLDEPISMNFANETPLEDIIKYIKSATQGPTDTGIPIYVDPVGLKQADATLESAVTLDLEGVPLKTTLRLLLRQLNLAYCVKDGLLIISSVEGVFQELSEAESTQNKGILNRGFQ